jgi:hypothetical protein
MENKLVKYALYKRTNFLVVLTLTLMLVTCSALISHSSLVNAQKNNKALMQPNEGRAGI